MYLSYCASLLAMLSLSACAPRSLIPRQSSNQTAKAAYFMDNNPNNSIITVKINADGTLSSGSKIPTGGKGLAGLNAGLLDGKSNVPTYLDSTSSSGDLSISEDNLIVANPGSNTISWFKIDPSDPLNPTLVGQPVDSLGDFPSSCAISAIINQACCTNTGTISGLACFNMSTTGLVPMGKLFPYELNQTYPTTFPNSKGINQAGLPFFTEVIFNDDSSQLIVTQAGNPTINGSSGYILTFPIVHSAVFTPPTVSYPNGTAVMFSALQLPGTRDYFVTDAAFGTAIINVDYDGVATTKSTRPVPGSFALCWAVRNPYTGTIFSDDVGHNIFTESNATTGDIITQYNGTSGAVGNLDLYSVGDKVWALAPNANMTHIVVIDTSAGPGNATIIQNYPALAGSVPDTDPNTSLAAHGLVVYVG